MGKLSPSKTAIVGSNFDPNNTDIETLARAVHGPRHEMDPQPVSPQASMISGIRRMGSRRPSYVARVEAAWKAGHDRLAGLSSRGRNTVVPGTGHYIQVEQPDAVIDAVRDVVTAVRASGKPGQ